MRRRTKWNLSKTEKFVCLLYSDEVKLRVETAKVKIKCDLFSGDDHGKVFPSSTRYQPFIEFYNFTMKKLKLNRFIESENCVENDYNFLLFFIFLLPFPRCATENSTTTTYKGNCIAHSRAEIKQHIAPTVGRVKWLCSNLISFETSNFSSVSTSFSNVSRRLTFIFMAWSGSLWRNWI